MITELIEVQKMLLHLLNKNRCKNILMKPDVVWILGIHAKPV